MAPGQGWETSACVTARRAVEGTFVSARLPVARKACSFLPGSSSPRPRRGICRRFSTKRYLVPFSERLVGSTCGGTPAPTHLYSFHCFVQIGQFVTLEYEPQELERYGQLRGKHDGRGNPTSHLVGQPCDGEAKPLSGTGETRHETLRNLSRGSVLRSTDRVSFLFVYCSL